MKLSRVIGGHCCVTDGTTLIAVPVPLRLLVPLKHFAMRMSRCHRKESKIHGGFMRNSDSDLGALFVLGAASCTASADSTEPGEGGDEDDDKGSDE
jgi:hypothetical protein